MMVNNTNNCFFSLITGSLGRTRELELLMHSLADQTFKDFELVIVDQNSDGLIDELIKSFSSKLNIVHLRVAPGLSRARNIAMKAANGAWYGFPDDDCRYPPDLLANLHNRILKESDYDVISVMVTDESGKYSAGGYMSGRSQLITKRNIWRCAVSPSIFIKRKAAETIDGFDENLGVGAGTSWGAGEETDFLLKLVKSDHKLQYIAELLVFHPQFTGPWNRKAYSRGFMYGCGMGYVLRKHDYSFMSAIWFAALQVLRAIQAISLCNPGKARYHLSMSAGRLYGFWSSGRSI